MAKRTVKQKVEDILRTYPDSRGDDKILQLLYWKLVDEIDFTQFPQEYVKKATPSESITRARRIIQEEGRYLPPEDVVEMRKQREMGMRSSIRESREVI